MRNARMVVLALAVSAAVGAAWIAKTMVSSPEPKERIVERNVNTIEVLVAASDIRLGDSVKAENMRWQEWPSQAAASGYITRNNQPEAQSDFSGAIARAPFLIGEPIKEQKLIKVSEGGVMAAILPAGMRAISTPIREETAAGGFILPNDRVDVIVSRKVRTGSREESVSETVLKNVRVLAIGQTIDQKGDEKTASGKTATLELTPRQTEMLALAQNLGEISLSLRSLADSAPNGTAPEGSEAALGASRGGTVKMLKYGIPSRAFGVN